MNDRFIMKYVTPALNIIISVPMDTFQVGKRRAKFKNWEPIFIGTHEDPLYDERLTYEGRADKMTQVCVLLRIIISPERVLS